ncbi:MAG: hypothetical protein AAGI63_01900 [Planctomycetota bacterium]
MIKRLAALLAWLCLGDLSVCAQPAETPNIVTNKSNELKSAVAQPIDSKVYWVWSDNDQQTTHLFKKQFELPSAAVAVRLKMATHSCGTLVRINREVVAESEPFDPMIDESLAVSLPSGPHRLEIEATSIDGPPAFFATISFDLADDQRRVVSTDASWSSEHGSVLERSGVATKLLVAKNRKVRIGAADNYEQWKQALGSGRGPDPASFALAPGFEIRLVRAAEENEDSWVSMAFDSQGRVIIAKEKTGLLRMELSEDGNSVTSVQPFADSLQECRGLQFVEGNLYANANNSKALYRIPFNDNRFGEPQQIFTTSGGVGHGRNDLTEGPDGMLYSIHGDAVDIPNEQRVLDYTSPFREHRNGHSTREGHLLRIDPKSADVTVVAGGLRNPFGIDFNRDGEAFTYDADAEFDMGAPWYRPTRVVHLVAGADYGWRGVTGNWPPYYPDHADNADPGLDVGKGSPTAVKFGNQSDFPGRFGEALFVLDWAYGRVVAIHMIPRGASYMMVAETFLKGRPLNVTDLAFAPDGSMYLVTGGRQTQSSLFRVQWTGKNALTKPNNAFTRSRRQHAKESRQTRNRLESAMLQPASGDSLRLAWEQLGSPDPSIAFAARTLLEHQPVETWLDKSLSLPASRESVQSLLALARSGMEEHFPRIVRRLNEILPSVVDRNDRTAAFETYRICCRQLSWMDSSLRQQTSSVLNDQFPSHTPLGPVQAHNWLLSELLIALEHPAAITKSIDLLQRAEEQRDQMHYLYVLRNAKSPWRMNERRVFFSSLNQAQQYLVGAGMAGFLTRIREEAVATLTPTERSSLKLILEPSVASQPVATEENRPFVKAWAVDDFQTMESAGDDQKGDADNGARIFASAKCSACHRYGSQGALVGPDLTSAARRFNRRDMLTSILEPSKVIAENYQAVQIVTVDGKTHSGLATMMGDYRSPLLRLATNPATPMQTIEIPKNDIELQRPSAVSWMPKGLLDTFTREEIRDLLTYLQSTPE